MLNVSPASPPRDIGAYTLFGSGMLLGGAFALGVLTSESGTSSTHTLYCMLWGSVVFAGFVCGMKASALYWNSVASAPMAPTIGMQGAPTPLHMRCFQVMCAPVPLCTLAAELLMLTGACFGLVRVAICVPDCHCCVAVSSPRAGPYPLVEPTVHPLPLRAPSHYCSMQA